MSLLSRGAVTGDVAAVHARILGAAAMHVPEGAPTLAWLVGRLPWHCSAKLPKFHRVRSSLASGAAPGAVTGATLALMLVMPASILIIADHVDIATLIARGLVSVGLRPLIAGDLRQAGLILQREAPEAVVLDLATPGHCESVMQWLRREPSRAGMAVVRVSARARPGGASRNEISTEIHVPKPFTPRQIVDGVRTALFRRGARQKVGRSLPLAAAAIRATAGVSCAATAS